MTLRASLKLAKRAGLWLGDIDAFLPVGFAPDYRPRTRALSTEELGQLLALLAPARAAQVGFIVATSACWSEAVKARRCDVQLESGWVHIRGTKRAAQRSAHPRPTPRTREPARVRARARSWQRPPLPALEQRLPALEQRPAHPRRLRAEPASSPALRTTCAAPTPSGCDSHESRLKSSLQPWATGTRAWSSASMAACRLRKSARCSRPTSLPTASPVHQTAWIRPENVDGMDVRVAPTARKQCPGAESNHRHGDFQSPALPTELPGRVTPRAADSRTRGRAGIGRGATPVKRGAAELTAAALIAPTAAR